MRIINTVEALQTYRQSLTEKNIGFVPTMGNLHAGHQQLLHLCRQQNDVAILSIFVNNTQFNNADDLAKYPKTLTEDLALAEAMQIDAVFIPDYATMYPDDYCYKIQEQNFSKLLCGQFRPGHFDGVLTIVLKLLMLTQPDRLYLGEKDYQQLYLIEQMIKAFFIPTKVIPVATVRNTNGLALSSRNQRLNEQQKQLAEQFAVLLAANKSISEIKNELINLGIEIDYIEEYWQRRFAAVTIGGVRLIDNVEIERNV